jgi:DNA-binding NtrC family response regulator
MDAIDRDPSIDLRFLEAVRTASSPAPARFGRLYGDSPGMQAVYRLIDKVAPTEAAVFIVGESGCGKEVVAQTIHDRSARSGGPFVAVNCGAIPANLIEAELFGYEKGAFTGAARQHRGFFERAAGGTLFLDEITEMPPEMQVRLLRVLESGRFTRVGGDQEIHTNVRIVSATNRDPAVAVRDGQLREDLMYRLAVFPIQLPPLRERGDDVEQLALYFLEALNREAGTSKRMSRTAARALRSHAWPGNVRELRNVIQRAFIVSDDEEEIDLPALHGAPAPAVNGELLQFAIGTSIAEMERAAIFATLAHTGGDKKRCAEMLGVSVKTLYNRLTSYSTRAAPAVPSACAT